MPVHLVKGEQKSPEYLARNPQGLVPALDIDGLRLTQSPAILSYVDDTRQHGPVAAHAREISGRADAVEQWMHRFIRPGLQAVETLLAGFAQTPHAWGNAPGLADICLMPQLCNAPPPGCEDR